MSYNHINLTQNIEYCTRKISQMPSHSTSPHNSLIENNDSRPMECDEDSPNNKFNTVRIKREPFPEECEMPITPKLGTFCPIEPPGFIYSNISNFAQHDTTSDQEETFNSNIETCSITTPERISPTPFSVEINITSDDPSSPGPTDIPYIHSETPSSNGSPIQQLKPSSESLVVKQDFGDYYICPISTTSPQPEAQAESPENGHSTASSYNSTMAYEESGECIHSWPANNGGEF